MVHAEEEAGEFARIAAALTINIGTLSSPAVAGMKAAIAGANSAGKPWVLDPVACFATGFRRQVTAELMALRPAIIRGNASEILALGGGQSAGQGADSGDPVEKAQGAARLLAKSAGAVVAVTGPVDFVTDGERAVHIAGGSPLMPKVTALGCSLTCLVGALVAVAPDGAVRGHRRGAGGLCRGWRGGCARGAGSGQFCSTLSRCALRARRPVATRR